MPAPCAKRSPPRASWCPQGTCTSFRLLVGGERDALALCQGALERGVFAQAIRPPSVPAGTARLRLTAMASHTPAELRRAARALGEAARAAGLEPAELQAPATRREAVEKVEEVPEEPQRSKIGQRARAPGPAASPVPFDIEREDALIRAA